MTACMPSFEQRRIFRLTLRAPFTALPGSRLGHGHTGATAAPSLVRSMRGRSTPLAERSPQVRISKYMNV